MNRSPANNKPSIKTIINNSRKGKNKYMEQNKEDKMWEEAINGIIAYEKECLNSLEKILEEHNILNVDIESVMDGCKLSGYSEIVSEPKGYTNNESYGKLKFVHFDEWSIGDSGDSYEGFMYAKIKDNVWIKIPYKC